jgi:hypothetical protein
MPALLHDFDELPLPDVALVDSSFLFQVLIDSLTDDGRHQQCAASENALRTNQTALIYSPLIHIEATQCWKRLFGNGTLAPTIGTLNEATGRMIAFQEASALSDQFLG